MKLSRRNPGLTSTEPWTTINLFSYCDEQRISSRPSVRLSENTSCNGGLKVWCLVRLTVMEIFGMVFVNISPQHSTPPCRFYWLLKVAITAQPSSVVSIKPRCEYSWVVKMSTFAMLIFVSIVQTRQTSILRQTSVFFITTVKLLSISARLQVCWHLRCAWSAIFTHGFVNLRVLFYCVSLRSKLRKQLRTNVLVKRIYVENNCVRTNLRNS